MICTHTFVKVGEISKPRPSPVPTMIGVPGAEVVCVHCGQVRKLWADGKVEIVVKGGKPIEEDTLEKDA